MEPAGPDASPVAPDTERPEPQSPTARSAPGNRPHACTAFSIVPASRALISISNGRPFASRRNSTSHAPSSGICLDQPHRRGRRCPQHRDAFPQYRGTAKWRTGAVGDMTAGGKNLIAHDK